MSNSYRHVLLVGLPGAGKSSVGRVAAQRLGVQLFDIDELIENKTGKSVREIIEERGEREFRRLEKLETEQAFEQPFAVIVPGGGWAAEGDNLDNLPQQILMIYLETSAHEALARVGESSARPLLNRADRKETMEELLSNRVRFYERCEVTVSTDGKTVQQVADEVVKLARGVDGG